MTSSTRFKLDLLTRPPLRSVTRCGAFPVVLQVATLAAMVALVAVGFGVGRGMAPTELLTLRKTNLTTLVVWGLWWPAMVVTALIAGRAWCTVCPLELLNRLGDSLARRLGWPRLGLGSALRAGWATVAAYLVLQLLVAGLALHRVPHLTAVMLMVLAGAALLSGLLVRAPRSFCRALCPAAPLLSVYGRVTPLQLEVRDGELCASCPGKECVRGERRGRGCPSALRPYDRHPSDGCVLCVQCAKVCPSDNIGFGVVAGHAPVRRRALLRPAEAAFVMVALGFVSHELIGEVNWLEGVFHTVPAALHQVVPSLPFGWFEALWFLALFPLAAWLSIAGLGYLLGYRGGLGSMLLAAATGAAPVVAAAHVAKTAAKLSSWAGFVPLAVHDPSGLLTLRAIADHSLAAPAALLDLTLVGWVMLALLATIAWRTWRWARQVPAESAVAATTGLACAVTFFGAVLTVWAWPTP